MGLNGNQGNRLSYLSLQNPGELVVPTYTNNDSFAQWNIDGIPDISTVRGKRITMVGTIRLTAAQTGTLSGQARRFAVQVNQNGTLVVFAPAAGSVFAPNAAGTYEVRIFLDIPADATAWGFLRAFNGDQPSGLPVYWSNVAMVVGQYDGPVLDGDMPGCVWRGAPHDSPTVGYRLAA